ncbi:MAG TPA: membrane protein insertase YidC [Flavisolibacter sp.]|jgi:YidC/Oxa1 family membrane protein insertase|nr:membrane protein insertase YidC [Flavisolibacter sp.]
MNFDRNTVIGFILLAVLFFGFFYYTNQQQAALQVKAQKEKAYKDSVARVDSIAKSHEIKSAPSTKIDSGNVAAVDSNLRFPQIQGTEQLSTVENDLIKVVFTNKGGQPKFVELKKFKAPDSNNVKLAGTDFDKIDYSLKDNNNKTDSISGLFFSGGQITKSGDDQIITYQLQGKDGSLVTHKFTVKQDYMIDFDLSMNNAGQLLSNNTLGITWQNQAVRQQKDLSYERQQSQIGYREDGDYHHSTISSDNEEFKKSVNWVAVKQQFFASVLVAKNNFSGGTMSWVNASDDKSIVWTTANLRIPVTGSNATIPLSMYYGPTDYKMLKKYGNDMENMVDLGRGMWAFVKYINRWIVIPVFDFLSKLTTNYGIVILLLTLFIRLVTSPLMYPGYLTSAKMKILKPELEQLKAKYPDQQQYAMEQMKFMREAGVNQFAGCLPSLLQIPIFFALYSFFNSNVALRGQSFLWSHDLSQYDSIVNFGFNVPLYGDHVSLFTITAAVTSFLISLNSMSNTPDQGNPVLKYMPYFFPVILLFIFNRLPSGLTWYYTVSNVITLLLQYVIQNFIINHDRIIAQIDANRKKPKKQSKWQERMAQMQEQQKQMQDRNKNRR